MRKSLYLAVGAAVFSLWGCGGESTPASDKAAETAAAPASAKPVAPQDPAAGSSGTDSMTWAADNGGVEGRSRLRYVTPGTEEHLVSFECAQGGPVEVWPAAKVPEGMKAYSFVLGIVGQPHPLTANIYNGRPEATIPSNNFSGVRTTGQLAIGEEGKPLVEMNAINDAERGVIDKFFQGCGS